MILKIECDQDLSELRIKFTQGSMTTHVISSDNSSSDSNESDKLSDDKLNELLMRQVSQRQNSDDKIVEPIIDKDRKVHVDPDFSEGTY
jgi:hypothetical protein